MKTRDSWGSRLGIILAVAGSAIRLGNFLRFPATGKPLDNLLLSQIFYLIF
jgi:SNF family Na+-dependent transporter